MPDLTAVAANVKNSHSGVRAVRRQRPDLALTSEAQRRYGMLRRTHAMRYHTGPKGHDGAARETGILMADRLPDRGGGSWLLSEAFPKAPRVGKERWGQEAVTEVEGVGIAAIGLHPVAAPTALRLGRDGELPERHEDVIEWADAMLTMHRNLDHQCVIGGDVNARQHWEGSADLRDLIRAHDLDGIWDGLDLLMVTPGLRIVGHKVIPGVLPDHPLLRLDLNVRHPRRRHR